MPEWTGKTIGKVRIDKYLARGGMAEVYLGTHLTLDRPVAVKVLHSYVEENPDLLTRFQREAKVVAGMRHPNIVQIFDFDTIDGHPYIVMEYLKGPTLGMYLRGLHERDERLPPHQVARLLKGLAQALDYAHGLGIIHRDIKPANMLLHGKSDEIPLHKPLTNDVEAVLTDFGLVRLTNATIQTLSGIVSGTPNYMSPEQARGDKTDHRTDIYSLGVVLYEMLAGRVPFEGESTLTVIYKQINEMPPPIPGVTSRVQTVMNRALAKKPDDRYQTCREMAMDFFLAIGMTAEAETIHSSMHERQAPVEASQEIKSTAAESPPKPGRNLAWIGGAVAAFLCLIVLAVGGLRAFSTLNTPSISPAPTRSTDVPTAAITEPPTAQSSGLPDGANMVKISAGEYEVGTAQFTDEFHTAVRRVNLNDFWIDKYQVTNQQYEQFIQATGAAQPVIWPAADEKYPVRGVTWDQAEAYCEWAGKRLPSEAEWEAAGRGAGPNPQLYPWGNDPTADGKALDLPDQDTYEIGTLPFNVSPFGVFDLVGNVWEWVGQPYSAVQDGFQILRGGRFGVAQDLAYRLAVAPHDERYVKYAGFRCAADQVK